MTVEEMVDLLRVQFDRTLDDLEKERLKNDLLRIEIRGLEQRIQELSGEVWTLRNGSLSAG